MTTVIGILILVCALFLIVSVLLQSSKNHRMSGVVSGGAETFFGKQKGKTIDAALSKATAIIAVIFAVLVLVLYAISAQAGKADAPVVTEPDAGTVVEDVVDEVVEDAGADTATDAE